MIEQPLVSIIIPVYNLQDCINDCMKSVMSQTYRSLEIILIDDGSTDNSFDICRHYAKRDSRIQVEHQNNRGVSSARNLGLKKATGKYVTFIDGDDTVALDFVEKYVDQAKATKADIIIGGLTKIEPERESLVAPLTGYFNQTEFLSLLCKDGTEIYGYVCCKLYCLSLIKNNNILFNEKMSSQEDLEFALSVYEHAKTIKCFDNYGYYYEYYPPVRKVLSEPILGNQVKLYNIAKNVGADTDLMIPRFQSMLYTWLYHARSLQDIKNIINMTIPDGLLIIVKDQRKEVQKVIKLFRVKRSNMIYGFFSVRRKMRKILVRLHVLTPEQ